MPAVIIAAKVLPTAKAYVWEFVAMQIEIFSSLCLIVQSLTWNWLCFVGIDFDEGLFWPGRDRADSKKLWCKHCSSSPPVAGADECFHFVLAQIISCGSCRGTNKHLFLLLAHSCIYCLRVRAVLTYIHYVNSRLENKKGCGWGTLRELKAWNMRWKEGWLLS